MASLTWNIIPPLSPESTRPSLVSATYVAAEPTATQINNTPSYSHTAAYLSMRIMTVGGLTLLLIGLCCLAAVLLRFSRYERRTIYVVDNEKALVLDQTTINKSFPIRIYPSNQRLFLDEDEMVIATVTTPTPLPDTIKDIVENVETLSPTVEKQIYHSHQHHQHSFMGIARVGVGKLWSRESSRGPSRCNSPTPSQISQMPTFATSMTMLQNSNPPSPAILQPTTLIPMPPDVASEEKSDLKLETKEYSEELCSICLGEYETDDRIRILSCGHEYHAECVDIWLTHKSTHCPLCKHDLLDDIQPPSPIVVMNPTL
ncbi:MAG: hypothetical protein BYD32DRAFT_464960 [Podila humilis]|nr:MAG: hypothetical protein BYD32DRAFT_464960 [Podila humilis]